MYSIPRRTARCAIASLLLAAVSAAPASADAPRDPVAVATERYYSSYGEAPSSAELAREAYYSSYGESGALSRAGADSGEPAWLLAALAATGACAVAATARRRPVLRRRRRVPA